MSKDKKNILVFLIIIFLFYGCLHLFGITCPIKALTGISCPGCGMTRAYLSLLKLDFSKAYYYHPLFLLPVIALIFYIFRNHFSKNFLKLLTYIFIIMFLIVYFMRMMDPKDRIVVFRPYESIIYKIFIYFKNLF